MKHGPLQHYVGEGGAAAAIRWAVGQANGPGSWRQCVGARRWSQRRVAVPEAVCRPRWTSADAAGDGAGAGGCCGAQAVLGCGAGGPEVLGEQSRGAELVWRAAAVVGRRRRRRLLCGCSGELQLLW